MMYHLLENKPGKSGRLTIGYLDENGNDEYHGYITEGIIKAAKKYDVNVIRFGHFTSNVTAKQEYQINMLLECIEQFDLDGLLFLGWARAVSLENHESFKKRFSSIPIFSLGAGFDDIPNTYVPGDVYTRELIKHLINVHNRRRIAFIAPFWPDDRSRIYKETMKEFGIYDPELFVSEKELKDLEVPQRGRKAVSILIDERRVKFDAIVSLFNAETEGILSELNSRGIKVPADIALTSYEDGEVGKFISPAFTTVYFPWRELGFYSCEKLIELIRNGSVPLFTIVDGRVIYRDSCGCSSNSVNLVKACETIGPDKASGISDELDIEEIESKICSQIDCRDLDVNALLKAFLDDLEDKTGAGFLCELERQLRRLTNDYTFSGLEDFATVMRNILIPRLINRKDILLLVEDIFQQAQVMIRDKALNVWAYKEQQLKNVNENLQEISHILINNFSVKSLMDSLEENLARLNIPSCYVFMFNAQNMKDSLYDNCVLTLEYTNNSRIRLKSKKPCPARQKLSEILSSKSEHYALMANLLHVNDDFIGFVLYEPGPTDERVYQALSIHISTALNGAILLEKLDSNYKKLIEQAHKEGMANIATGMLHNIRNVLNSTSTSTHLMRDLINASSIDDFLKAAGMLEENIDNMEKFLLNERKGKKLLQFILKLGDQIEDLQNNLLYHIERLSDKVTLIDDVLAAQQSYANVKSILEENDIAGIIDDAIKMNLTLLEKRRIEVVREYYGAPKARVQKVKLFHIIVNLIKNAVEAMEEKPGRKKVIVNVNRNDLGTCIKITDKGCGIHKDKLKSIFNYGYTTKKDGHGFGLHSCANYVAEMGGKIWAESEGPGKGATFVIQFFD